MASNRHAAGEDTFGPYGSYEPYDSDGDTSYGSYGSPGPQGSPGPHGGYGGYGLPGEDHLSTTQTAPIIVADPEPLPPPVYFGPGPGAGPDHADGDAAAGEWNPSADTLLPVRGRHRVVRQRGGTVGRSRAVLGVGVIAAVGAGGMATANEDGAPGMSGAASKMRAVPGQITSLGGLFGGASTTEQQVKPVITAAPLTSAGLVAADPTGTEEAAAAGEALRSRILKQAEKQDAIAETERRDAAVDAAIASASENAAELAEQERLEELERQRLEEERKRAEEERKRKEEEERQRKEEEERLAKLRASYVAPLSNYRISATYGQSGAMWATGYHTGLDLSSPAGTPVKNIHTGTVVAAAWAGSYGYQVIVELEDGTEVSYSHLSSMSVTAGQELITGDLIGNVGSTGNSSGPHLHIEVKPGGGDTVDPLAWMRNNGVQI